MRSAAAIGAALALGLPAAAGAARVIQIPDLRPAGVFEQEAPLFAFDAAGNNYATWTDYTSSKISFGVRAYGTTTFDDRTTVSATPDPTDPAAAFSGSPLIAADDHGNVTVVWQAETFDGDTSIVAATRLSGTHTFTAPVVVAPIAEAPTLDDLGMGADGTTVIIWNDGNGRERAAMRRTPAGAFAAPVTVLPIPAQGFAAGRDGTFTITATGLLQSGAASVLTARRSANGAAFGAPETVATFEPVGGQFATATATPSAGPNGRAWLNISASGGRTAVYSAGPSDAFSQQCSTSPARLLAGGPSGIAGLTVSQAQIGGPTTLKLLRAGGMNDCGASSAIAPIEVPAGLGVSAQTVEQDGAGGIHAQWSEVAPAGGWRLRTAYVAPAASGASPDPVLDDVVTTSSLLGPYDAAVDPFGNEVVSWSSGRDGEAPGAAVIDHEPPRLTGLSVPTRVNPGDTMNLSVQSADAYSPPTTVHWDVKFLTSLQGAANVTPIGLDGPSTSIAVPTGANIIMAIVRVTSADASGNQSFEQRQLPIGVPPTPRPPAALALKLATSRFKAVAVGEGVDRGTPAKGRGSALGVRTEAAGTGTFQLTRFARGRLVGSKCSGKAKKGKVCLAERSYPQLVKLPIPAGASNLRVTGRWGGKPLAAGVYRLTATITGPGGVSPAVSFKFRVLK